MKISLLFITLLLVIFSLAKADYWSEREKFVQYEESLSVGANIKLSENEEKVNTIFMKLKNEELQHGFDNPGEFSPAIHFFQAKKQIVNSKLFQLIEKMPKGGGLHLHDTLLTSLDYVIRNITYRDYLYSCTENGELKLAFADPPLQDPCWISVKSLREKNPDYDGWLRKQFSLVVDHPEQEYPDINAVWKKFESGIQTITLMITYKPVFADYFYQGLQELYDDNVNYVEVRGTLPVVYDLTGWPLNPIQTLGLLKKVADQFLEDHPDFLGIKYIYAPSRHVDEETVDEYIQIYNMMKSLYPDFLVGFDLVNQEDLGYPLTKFINELTEAAGDVKFFFHAGETNWNGMSSDMNLIDAVLLNTTRIGHGYGILKHPGVLKEVKQRGIGIEVNPISNQVLMLVKDLRNHPAATLLAEGYPVVISADGPSLWEIKGLSYDFYQTFMGIASASSDLKLLKQLSINSLMYSALEPQEKPEALLKWEKKWNKFIDEML